MESVNSKLVGGFARLRGNGGRVGTLLQEPARLLSHRGAVPWKRRELSPSGVGGRPAVGALACFPQKAMSDPGSQGTGGACVGVRSGGPGP
jgi:hypothetical protein